MMRHVTRLNALLPMIIAGLMIAMLGSSRIYAQPAIEVEIDRDEIVRGETITMTIRVNDRQGAIPMDISAFGNNFEVISTRSSSRLQTVNNRVQAWTMYTLVLFPRTLGEQEIPSILVDEHPTDPFPINVLAADDPSGASSHPELRMETTISSNNVFVQEQLLFTIRLYYTLSGLRNPNFTDLELDNAVVQMLGPPNQYEQLIEGVRYGVYEMNYVIFPQRSGSLVIPDIVFRAQVTDGSSRFVFRATNVEPVTAFASGTEVTVRERPSVYPQNATWLPSGSVSINEQWSDNIDRLSPGDTVERTVTLTAFGLDGPALPPMSALSLENANVYANRPDIRRSVIDGNVVGERRESWSIVATDTGTLVVPEVRIPWWNTETEAVEYAVLPARTLVVSGPALREPSTPANGVALQDSLDLLPDAAPDPLIQPDSLVSAPRTPAWIMAVVAALLAAVATILLALYRHRTRREAHNAETAPATEAYQRSIAENQESLAFRDLQLACKGVDAGKIRVALIAWGRQYYRDSQLHTLDALSRRTGDADIHQASRALQAALYGHSDNGQTLDRELASSILTAITRLREREREQRRKQRKQASYSLPPLYRSQ